jgi:dTDP-4-amino-4,6-dideoxygalactose transaminase
MTTAEGGAVASVSPELLERVRRFSRQGLVRNPKEFKITDQGSWHQEVHEFGLNYRLPDVLCALGISQLKRLQTFKTLRREVFEGYYENLGAIPNLELPTKRDYVDPMWHLFPIRVSAEHRRKIFDKLRSAGFLVQVNYLPANQHPVFAEQGYNVSDTPEAQSFYSREISLPMMANPSVLSANFFLDLKDCLINALKGEH